jgi:hypothetical protein
MALFTICFARSAYLAVVRACRKKGRKKEQHVSKWREDAPEHALLFFFLAEEEEEGLRM